MRNLKRAYFNWLYDKVVDRRDGEYSKLCLVLYDRKFTWFVPNDDNRCQDGVELRETFLQERKGAESTGIIDMFLKEDCTVFEILAGIAYRMDFILYEPGRGERVRKWFTLLIKNLGLNVFTDDHSEAPEFLPYSLETIKIDEILDIWMNRKYDRYGAGGSLFPIKGDCPRDMRRTEIWYQMHAYIQENFDI